MSSYQTRNRKFQKNTKKIQKFKKHHYGFSSCQNKLGKAMKDRKKKKKICSDDFLQELNRKFQKKSKKIQKIRKHYYGFLSSQNTLGKAEKGRK